MDERKNFGIIYRRGGAGKQFIPASSRLGGVYLDNIAISENDTSENEATILLNAIKTYSTGDDLTDSQNELKEHD